MNSQTSITMHRGAQYSTTLPFIAPIDVLSKQMPRMAEKQNDNAASRKDESAPPDTEKLRERKRERETARERWKNLSLNVVQTFDPLTETNWAVVDQDVEGSQPTCLRSSGHARLRNVSSVKPQPRLVSLRLSLW